MQLQFQISGSVCEIETDDRSGFVSGLGDRLHVECLAGVIIHATEHNERDLIAITFDRFDYVFGAKRRFAVTRGKL